MFSETKIKLRKSIINNEKISDVWSDNAQKLISYANTTNNIMEMTGVLKALLSVTLKSAAELAQYEEAIIYTDSAYVANCINQRWYATWFTNGWLTSKKEPVKNKEYWELLLDAYFKASQLIPLKIELVKGHSTNTYNNLADTTAVAARKGECKLNEVIPKL